MTSHDTCCCTETLTDLRALKAACSAYADELTHRLNTAIAERDRARDTAARLEAELARGFRVAAPDITLTRTNNGAPETPDVSRSTSTTRPTEHYTFGLCNVQERKEIMDIPPSGIRVTTQEELDKVLTERPGQNIHIDSPVGVWLHVFDSTTVYAHGESWVRAHGRATVIARDSTTVYANDLTTVHVYDSAKVSVFDKAMATAHGSSVTIVAYDSATVWAYDSANVGAYDSATVWANDSTTVWAYDLTKATAFGLTTVDAYDSATVEVFDKATATAHGSSVTVHAHNSTN